MARYKPRTELSHRGIPLEIILKSHEGWLKERRGEKADLIGADLSGVDLGGVYLRGADMIKVNLSAANLERANLSEANLYGANMVASKLLGANMMGANLERVTMNEANLKGIDFTEANLKKAHLAWANMSRASFIGADLREAYIRGALLTDADFTKAGLCHAKLTGAEMTGCKMIRADISDGNLSETILKEADLSYANLSRTDLREADLEKACLHSANLSHGILTAASLIGADLTGADLGGVCIDKANLSEWIIKDVTCSHIVRGHKREVIRFNLGEFEKKYAHTQKLFEIVLSIPLIVETFHLGRFIMQSINRVMLSPVISLKGIEALSEVDTKLVFLVTDDFFFENNREVVEISLKDALIEYFHENPLDGDDVNSHEAAEDTKSGLENNRDDGPKDSPPWQLTGRPTQQMLIDRYDRLEKIGTSIFDIVSSIFQDTKAY